MPTLSPAAVALGFDVEAEIPSADPAAVARFIRAHIPWPWNSSSVSVRTVRDLDGFSRVVLVVVDRGAESVADYIRALGVPGSFRHDYSAGEAECSVALVDASLAPAPLTVRRALLVARPL